VATHYEVLGVEPNAPKSAIRAAYRNLAKHYHPDLAYEVLADSLARANYDAAIMAGAHRLPSRPTPASRQPTPSDPLIFLVHVFRPLDACVRKALHSLRVAIDELAYDIYDETFLARFATALAGAEDDIDEAERQLRSHVWPVGLATALLLYGQGLRQIEDALGEFQAFTQNFNVDLLAWAIDILAQGTTNLDQACNHLP
jgi:molecular chaperone DnaJ